MTGRWAGCTTGDREFSRYREGLVKYMGVGDIYGVGEVQD
jgi:hypothetical protein